MADDYAGLAILTLAEHGDARERDVWPAVAGALSNHENFWRELVVLLTNRILPMAVTSRDWVRIRQSIPVEYERLAMRNYSLFYYAATAWRAIEDDRKRLASGEYPHPERVFAAMQACVEQAQPLQQIARAILRRILIEGPELPTHPQRLYETIGAYRNAFAHSPVLGRAVDQGRELLPPLDRLPKKGGELLWREAAEIPTADMIDGLKLVNDLREELAEFLQAQWKSLTELFIEARKHSRFVQDLGLGEILPIRSDLTHRSAAGPLAAFGAFGARSDAH